MITAKMTCLQNDDIHVLIRGVEDVAISIAINIIVVDFFDWNIVFLGLRLLLHTKLLQLNLYIIA